MNEAGCRCGMVKLPVQTIPKEVYYCWCDSCQTGPPTPSRRTPVRWHEVARPSLRQAIATAGNWVEWKHTLKNRPQVCRVVCKSCNECVAMCYEHTNFARLPPNNTRRCDRHACDIFHIPAVHGPGRTGLSFRRFPSNVKREKYLNKLNAPKSTNGATNNANGAANHARGRVDPNKKRQRTSSKRKRTSSSPRSK